MYYGGKIMRLKSYIAAALLLLSVRTVLDADAISLTVAHKQNTDVIPAFEVFEITFDHDNNYADPFFDVAIDAVFTSPTGKRINVGGFHYGSSAGPVIHKTESGERQRITYEFDKQNIWKARFAPGELGKWTYSFTFTNSKGGKTSGKGAFSCIKGRKPNPGFLRINPANPFRFVFDDGSAYFPIGLQDCWGDNSGTGSVLDQCSMEGPFRTDRKDLPPLPEGPLFVRGPANNPQNADVYFRYFSQCGFNLYRYSPENCSFPLNRNLEKYLVQEGVMTDEILRYARKYGFRMCYGIFGFQKAFNNDAGSEENMARVKRFIKYSVDRWGAYVDFWEFLNEQKAEDKWYEITIPYLQSIDPYHHPITTSWERPELDGIEINAPHWYQRENELQSDAITASRAKNWKKHGKPVVVGEQGNHVDRNNRPLGVGGVWDDRSALRMRIRNWTAMFSEIAFIFWNTSYARDGHFMNIWLGPKEREYVRAMQDFAYYLDKDVRPIHAAVSDAHAARAYALASKENAAVYLHHFANHRTKAKGLKVTIDVPKDAKGYWYSPETAEILETIEVSKGTRTLEIPEFTIDIALLITSSGPPDIDKDGRANNMDPDDDNDGVPDEKDAFPLEPEEWLDKDKDLIGDNLDADDDGDGVADDDNKNGMPDWEELDFDGDGFDRSKSVPWDAFPFDAKEWRDTDGDGTGDNGDTDDDNDGFSDEEENKAGTNPLDKLSFPHEAQPIRYSIIVTGNELLVGAYADGHTQFIAKTLGPLGLRCVGSISVDDKEADIIEALGFAARRAELVIVTGGLGPTDNDVTREALSAFTKISLKEHPEALLRMSQRFGRPANQIRANLRRQTQTPVQGTYLKNRNGTAIGLIFEQPSLTVIALPGPPRELQPMVADELVPYLSRRFGSRKPGCSLKLRFVGLGQSQIDQTIDQYVPLPKDLTTSSSFEGGRVDFTFTMPGDTPQDYAGLNEIKRKIALHLGASMYASDETSLEQHVIEKFAERRLTIAIAEISSGGSLAASLNTAKGADRVLAGAYVAPNEKALYRLLGKGHEGDRSIENLAETAANAAESKWAIAIGQAENDTNGASYVNVAFKLPGLPQTERIRLRNADKWPRNRLITQLLDEIRRRLK